MRKIKKSGFLKNKSFNIVSRFFLSSFIVISFFYVAPIIINFTDKNFNNKEFTNNSKNILNNTLNKDTLIEEDTTADADERDLLYDILEENNSEINLVRYTTSEIDSLFKEVNYNLKDVRDTKLVKPIDIGLLPNEIKNLAIQKSNVDFMGYLPQDQVIPLIRGSFALIQPSLAEGISSTVLEAMACNVPIIASDVGGNKELIILITPIHSYAIIQDRA